jgi:LPXTG-motif cell wall-anchored protein
MKNITLNVNKMLIALAFIVVTAVVASQISLADDCEGDYGGGDTCIVNKSFKIRKWVRLEGDSEWKDEVDIDLSDKEERNKKIEFRVEVWNLVSSDDIDVTDMDFDDMKMKDIWPHALKYLEESKNDLTERWDDFKPGDKKSFYFKAKIQSDEKNKAGIFSKCVINKAELYYGDHYEGSDDAVVCWKKTHTDEIKELPKTGVSPVFGLAGLGLITAGLLVKKHKKSAAK